ncbi:MAG: hypothetical protein U9N81_12500 [Bacillota bacterium]|nr:hypothetical protein [Bacillota bacterium]
MTHAKRSLYQPKESEGRKYDLPPSFSFLHAIVRGLFLAIGNHLA